MEEDDVTIREQNFHSQVREYIVSTERLMKSDRVCLPCCSLSHLASIACVSWNENINGCTLILIFDSFYVENVLYLSEVHQASLLVC